MQRQTTSLKYIQVNFNFGVKDPSTHRYGNGLAALGDEEKKWLWLLMQAPHPWPYLKKDQAYLVTDPKSGEKAVVTLNENLFRFRREGRPNFGYAVLAGKERPNGTNGKLLGIKAMLVAECDQTISDKNRNPHLAKLQVLSSDLIEKRLEEETKISRMTTNARLKAPTKVRFVDLDDDLKNALGGLQAIADDTLIAFSLTREIEGHDFWESLSQLNTFSKKAKLQITIKLLLALRKLHDRGILHRDLKPENIMIEELTPGVFKVTIIDFGCSRLASEINNDRCGTLGYMAPEIYNPIKNTQIHTRQSDIWSIAMLITEMWTGELPSKSTGDTFQDFKKAACSLQFPSTPEFKGPLGIIQAMSCTDPEERITLDQAIDAFEALRHAGERVSDAMMIANQIAWETRQRLRQINQKNSANTHVDIKTILNDAIVLLKKYKSTDDDAVSEFTTVLNIEAFYCAKTIDDLEKTITQTFADFEKNTQEFEQLYQQYQAYGLQGTPLVDSLERTKEHLLEQTHHDVDELVKLNKKLTETVNSPKAKAFLSIVDIAKNAKSQLDQLSVADAARLAAMQQIVAAAVAAITACPNEAIRAAPILSKTLGTTAFNGTQELSEINTIMETASKRHNDLVVAKESLCSQIDAMLKECPSRTHEVMQWKQTLTEGFEITSHMNFDAILGLQNKLSAAIETVRNEKTYQLWRAQDTITAVLQQGDDLTKTKTAILNAFRPLAGLSTLDQLGVLETMFARIAPIIKKPHCILFNNALKAVDVKNIRAIKAAYYELLVTGLNNAEIKVAVQTKARAQHSLIDYHWNLLLGQTNTRKELNAALKKHR